MNDQRPMENEFAISRYITQKASYKGIPIHGAFELTGRCNFNCRMCYVHENKNIEAMKQKELSTAQWLDIAKAAREKGMLFLLLTGGEVMMRQDFMELYTALSQMGFRIVINTNGSLLDPQVIELFKKYPPGRVNVSLYGADEDTYEAVCGVRAMNAVQASIRQLKAAGISVRLNMTLTYDNCRDMEDVYMVSQECHTLCAMSAYLFPPSRLSDTAAGSNPGRMSAEDAGCYMVERERLLMGDERFKETALKRLKPAPPLPESEQSEGSPSRCYAGRSSFWITWDGKMRPCGMMTCPEADVVMDGFDLAWEKIRTDMDKVRLPRACAGCPDRILCRACAAMCQAETGTFDRKPEYVCKMTAAMKKAYREWLDCHE